MRFILEMVVLAVEAVGDGCHGDVFLVMPARHTLIEFSPYIQ